MSLFWTSPLGPVLILGLGALVLILSGQRLPDKVHKAAPLWLAGIVLLLWLLLRLQPSIQARYLDWAAPLGLNSAFGYQLDGWAWLAGAAIGLILFVGVALPGWRQRPGFVDPLYWALLVATSAWLVVLSDTWISLFGMWALLMLSVGLVAGEKGSGSPFVWSAGILSTFLLLASALFNSGITMELPLGSVSLNIQAQWLLTLAAIIPLGVYPFHVWLTPMVPRAPGRYLAIHLIPAMAALHLLGRFDLPLLSSQAWAPLGAVALFGSALAAWADQNSRRSWIYVLINRSSWALLVLGLSRLPAPAGAVFPLVTLSLGGVLWAISRAAPWHYRWNLPLFLAAAVLYGLPFTPGFVPTAALNELAGSAAVLPAWLLTLIAQTLLVASLFNPRQPEIEEADVIQWLTPRSVGLTLAIVTAIALWWGVSPSSVAGIAGIPADEFAVGISGLSANPISWLTYLSPLLVGSLLIIFDERLFGVLREWQNHVARIARLEWLYAGMERLLHSLAVSLGILSDLIDGAGQFGWMLLVALLVWILLSGQ